MVTLFFLAAPSFAAREGLSEGMDAPNFVGEMLDGKYYSLARDGRGPKVLNFFWVKCVPCKKELPELAELEKKHPGVKFISVHTETTPEKEVKAFLASLAGHPRIVVMSTRKVMESYRFNQLPHTVILDADNRVRFVISGYTDENMRKVESAIRGIE
ncbi:MAG: TlpA family protein disulfide reductase [Nitrospinae bacterium]|nr:TlpA family protein disulfide reductase [Nitrospinota bacterium]